MEVSGKCFEIHFQHITQVPIAEVEVRVEVEKIDLKLGGEVLYYDLPSCVHQSHSF